MLSNMKLRTKLIGAFVLVALVPAVIGTIALRSMGRIAQADQRLYEEATVPLPELSDISVAFQRMRVASRDFIFAEGDLQKRAKFEEQLTTLSADIEKVSNSFEKRNLSPEMRRTFEDYKMARRAYLIYLTRIMELAKAGKDRDAWAILWSDGYNTEVTNGLKSIDKMEELKVEEARQAVEDNKALAAASIWQMIVAISIGLVLAIGSGVLLTAIIVRPLGMFATSMAASSDQLSAVSHDMSSNAEETSAQANVVATAAEQVTQNMHTVGTSTEEMTASIREIAKNAHEAAKVATSAVRSAEMTNNTMSKLGESSAEIGQVVKVITSIAQQTNLLALNATIEAARAGEAGKGFAVVANEVKELAKETARATEDISRKIELIQGNTKEAIDTISQIGGVIAQINDISNTIASAVEEQSATTNEIARNVAEAVLGSSQVTENIASVATAAKNTTSGAAGTQRAAQDLARMAAGLQQLVGHSSRQRRNGIPHIPHPPKAAYAGLEAGHH